MPTNLHVDESLLREAQEIGNFKTKSETVNQALKAFVEYHKQLEIFELKGKVDYYEDYASRKARQER